MARTKAGDRADRSGQMLAGRYRIERLVGIGAMGSIWAVRDVASGLEAVAKVHEAALASASDPMARERFLREAIALASVRHPNVVSLLEVGQTEAGEPFLIMERLVGEPLDERLARGRPTVNEVLTIGIELLGGLEAVHAAGVLHRDVKPENVFLARVEGGTLVKLLDFGLARGLGWPSGKITRVGVAVGTPGYMSREQARGRRDLDARTDLYSVGVVLYELLSARRPFEGLTPTDVMVRSCTEPPVPLSRYRPDLPPVLTSVIMRALACDRRERFDDACRTSTFAARHRRARATSTTTS
ncbi:MAG TPA: serine/threonine-protein kinase, partial [Sandaracinaceae bacterium]